MGLFNKDKEFDYVIGLDAKGNPITHKIKVGTGKGECAAGPGRCKEHQTKEQWSRTHRLSSSFVNNDVNSDDSGSVSLDYYNNQPQESTIVMTNEDAWKVPNYGSIINKSGKYGEVTVREVDGKYQIKVVETTVGVDDDSIKNLTEGVFDLETKEGKGSLSEWDKSKRQITVSGWRAMTDEQLDAYSKFLDIINSK